jgi:cytochrome b561
MGLKNTPDRYGTMAVSIHWLSALLIIVAIASGFRAADTLDPAAKAAVLRLHVPIAIAVLVLTVLRIVWWWGLRPKIQAGCRIAALAGARGAGGACPVLRCHPRNDCKRHRDAGAERRSAIIFGGEGALLPDFWKYRPRLPHGIGARLLLALLVLHAGAALYHHFGRRDGLLRRMWFSR